VYVSPLQVRFDWIKASLGSEVRNTLCFLYLSGRDAPNVAPENELDPIIRMFSAIN